MKLKIGEVANHPNAWFALFLLNLYIAVSATVSHERPVYIALVILNMLLSLGNMLLRSK